MATPDEGTGDRRPEERRGLARFVPAVGWLRRYRKGDLRYDLIAGCTLAAFAIPESLAYATLAGVPAQTGLYAGVAAMLTYALLGSSRLLASGVTSALAVLNAGVIVSASGGDAKKAAALASFAALVAGVAALIGWLCRLGFLANLVSKTVLTGFSFGAGLYIASTQVEKLFGFKGGKGEFFERVGHFIGHLHQTHLLVLGIGAAAFAIQIVGKRLAPRLPWSLILVVLALIAAPLLGLEARGVPIVGDIPRGLPMPGLPTGAFAEWKTLLPLGLSLFILSYVEGTSAARSLAAKHGGRVDPNQELLANGAGQLVSGLFRGMSVGGSLTRSSVNVSVGARTPLTQAVGGLLMLLVVLFFTGLFRLLPETVLAAVVLVAVGELLDMEAMARLFRLSRREFGIAVLTGVAVLVFGMLWGVIAGVMISLLDLLERATFPRTSVLGRVPGTHEYADAELHPENTPEAGVLVLRVDASVIFANAHQVKQDVLDQLSRAGRPLRLVILDLESSPLLDLSGAEMLRSLRSRVEKEGVAFRIAGVKSGPRQLLRADAPGEFRELGPGLDVGQVLSAWRTEHPVRAV